MTSRTITSQNLKGYKINCAASMPIIEDALLAFIGQIEAYDTHYTSGTTLIRFDLSLPEHMAIKPDAGSETALIAAFFKKLKERLGYKVNGGVRKFIYGWVREVEKRKKGHFHCFIGVPLRLIRVPGKISNDLEKGVGTMGLIEGIWQRLCDGGRVWYVKTHKVVDEASCADAIYHVSYMAKLRGKSYSNNAGHRNWASSRLKPCNPLAVVSGF